MLKLKLRNFCWVDPQKLKKHFGPHKLVALINLSCLEEIHGHDAKIIWLPLLSAHGHHSLNKSIMKY